MFQKETKELAKFLKIESVKAIRNCLFYKSPFPDFLSKIIPAPFIDNRQITIPSSKWVGGEVFLLCIYHQVLIKYFRWSHTWIKILKKTNISYPLIHKRTCAYQGVRNINFSGSSGFRDFSFPCAMPKTNISNTIVIKTCGQLFCKNNFSTWTPLFSSAQV